MIKVCGIYMIENTVNRHIYIGSSNDIEHRIYSHSIDLDINKHFNQHLQRAYNKYGVENFVYDVLITCHPDMLLFYEQQFIDQWKPEYNMSKIAGKIEMTVDVRYKISIANKGKPSHNKGKIFSVETCAKISKSRKGKPSNSKGNPSSRKGKKLPEETCRKMSESHKGKPSNRKGKPNPFKGKKYSEEIRKRMSEAHIGKPSNRKGKKASDKTRNKIKESWKRRHERMNAVLE